MQLAREAVALPERERLAWVIGCSANGAIVEQVLRMVLSYDESADQLGLSLAAEPFISPELPAAIGRFRVTGLLGAGSFSRVYRVIDPSSNDEVALKVLTAPMSAKDAVARFEREVEALSRLEHPRIARMLDSGSAPGEHGVLRWIAIVLVEGKPFREQAQGKDPRWMATVMAQVCRAVQYAHGEGVVHRDLKPSNVLVDASSFPSVLDFGVAALRTSEAQERLTNTGQVVGTVAYMSPEQVAGATPDERSDQFALGVMLFEALTGKLPHSDGKDGLIGLLSIAEWNGFISPELLRPLDRDLRSVLSRALDADPALRYPSVEALADDLGRWLSGQRILTARRGLLQHARRFVRQYRRAAAAVTIVMVLLTAGLASSVVAWREAEEQSQRSTALGDVALLPQLIHQVDSLWPQLPDSVPALEEWLVQAKGVQKRIPSSRRFATSPLTRASFDEAADKLPGAIQVVSQRMDRARTIAKRTGSRLEESWAAAADRVRQDPRMLGLELLPQLGLVPLGPDPKSGLEEFALADWGSLPQREKGDGDLILDGSTCPVLVLLPGGPFDFGSPEPLGRTLMVNDEYYVGINAASSGSRRVLLAPYLIGKYEVTQGQYIQAIEKNNSEFRAGEEYSGVAMTYRHPVEMVDHGEALRASQRMGCTLPTEAQWQCAAAPIERGLYWWPESKDWARAPENIEPNHRPAPGERFPWSEDKYRFHAPVGSFRPNPNGLHDVLGNVQEWCLDEFKVRVFQEPSMPLASGTGQVLADGGGDYACRGGSFSTQFKAAMIVLRHGPPGAIRYGTVGFRLARPVTSEE